MMEKNINLIFLPIIILLLFSGCYETPPGNGSSIIADHNIIKNYDYIPPSTISTIQDLHIYYGHTSHGSQIITGLNLLSHSKPYIHEVHDDLGHNGDTSWVPSIRSYLNTHEVCQMVMMSWCGGCSDNTEEGINIYLDTMTDLEEDFPDVVFVYMTGHLDGTGPNGNLYQCNNQIRDYCINNGKVLFDFADIESYDPDGNYYPWGSDICEWCTEWCQIQDCPSCSCAHSHCFNCYRKGKAWWAMMAAVVEEGVL